MADLSDEQLLQTYRDLPTLHVKRSWNAFQLDIAERYVQVDELVTFCRRRLTVIRTVLEERGEVVPGGKLPLFSFDD